MTHNFDDISGNLVITKKSSHDFDDNLLPWQVNWRPWHHQENDKYDDFDDNLLAWQVNWGEWNLPMRVCDFYLAMDVVCSTSSIFHLVAISIDRCDSDHDVDNDQQVD